MAQQKTKQGKCGITMLEPREIITRRWQPATQACWDLLCGQDARFVGNYAQNVRAVSQGNEVVFECLLPCYQVHDCFKWHEYLPESFPYFFTGSNDTGERVQDTLIPDRELAVVTFGFIHMLERPQRLPTGDSGLDMLTDQWIYDAASTLIHDSWFTVGTCTATSALLETCKNGNAIYQYTGEADRAEAARLMANVAAMRGIAVDIEYRNEYVTITITPKRVDPRSIG